MIDPAQSPQHATEETTCPGCGVPESAGLGQHGLDCTVVYPPTPKPHYYKDDIAWMGSGTDGDPWVMTSWSVVACTCDRPWRHAHGA